MTSTRKYAFRNGESGSAIAVRVTPRMSRNSIQEIMDDGTIKIRLAAPPVDGKANVELIKFLANILEIPEAKIEIVAGQTGRQKLISILGLDSFQVQQKIIKHLKN